MGMKNRMVGDWMRWMKSSGHLRFMEKYAGISNMDHESGYYPQDVYGKLLSDRIIILSGVIETNLCEYVKSNLLYLESISPNEDIKIYINSPGGSVYDGLGLIDIMDYIRPDVITVNTGLAASMGALILSSGTPGKRAALKRSRTMIHQPMTGWGDFSQASDLEIETKEILNVKGELYEIISKTTGRDLERVERDCDRNYWMNALETKEYGIIDQILTKRI